MKTLVAHSTTTLHDFDACHGIDYKAYNDDLTDVDVYVFSGNARRRVAAFADYNNAIGFATKLAKGFDQTASILVVVRVLGLIAYQIDIQA